MYTVQQTTCGLKKTVLIFLLVTKDKICCIKLLMDIPAN